VFNFSFTFEGNLPSTLRTYLNDANVSYKLRASAIRSAFSSNFHAQRTVTVVKSFTNEALEFNQTLEIENTWPGKVMYCLTLPFKAYAAGDEIPVNVKFMPLAKGVKVTSVSSVVKEYTQVHTRHSSHNEVRVAASIKHEIRNGRAYRVTEAGAAPVAPPHHFYGEDSVPPGSATPSAPPSPHHRAVREHSLGAIPPLPDSGLSSRIGSFANLAGASLGRAHDGYFAHPGSGSGSANATPGPSHPTVAEIPDDIRNADDDDINIGDDEVDTMITIPIPTWTTPSHNVHPVYVTHKIKWSCAISNPDGHVSELRCALPIHILPNAVLEEAQTASAGTRALLFGGQAEEATQVDLPSYNDHVYDRVANAALGPTTSYVASGNRTPHSAHSGTPPASRGPSRPGSPVLRPRHHHGDGEELHLADDIPARPQLNWADSELLLSLGGLAAANNSSSASAQSSPHATPPESRTPSLASASAAAEAHNPEAGQEVGPPVPNARPVSQRYKAEAWPTVRLALCHRLWKDDHRTVSLVYSTCRRVSNLSHRSADAMPTSRSQHPDPTALNTLQLDRLSSDRARVDDYHGHHSPSGITRPLQILRIGRECNMEGILITQGRLRHQLQGPSWIRSAKSHRTLLRGSG
jgi:hypothetical protein